MFKSFAQSLLLSPCHEELQSSGTDLWHSWAVSAAPVTKGPAFSLWAAAMQLTSGRYEEEKVVSSCEEAGLAKVLLSQFPHLS